MKVTRKTHAVGNRKFVKIAVSLKYLSNFWRTLEMPLIYHEINLILIWSTVLFFLELEKQNLQYLIQNVISIVNLSALDNAKLLEQLISGLKKYWNKYQSRETIKGPNPNLDYIIDPSFQRVNRLFALLFENTTDR